MSKPNVPRRWEKASEEQRQKMADTMTDKGFNALPESHIARSYRKSPSASQKEQFRKSDEAKNNEIKKLLRKLNGTQTPSEIWEEMVANDPSLDPPKKR